MPQPADKRLVIIRHGKAEYPVGIDDHERPLTARGSRETSLAGKWLVDNNVIPDQVVSSDAVRTRQSTMWVLNELGEQAPTPYLDSRLYLCTAAQALSVINETNEKVGTLLVIGHMDWVQDLGIRLASVDSDEQAVITMAEHYPASAVQVFEIPGDWASLDGRDARMTDFYIPHQSQH